jgi:RHS repeat-associated protein
MPDNQTWSRVVLTQRSDATNGVTSNWNYTYQVQFPLAAQECSGCVASFYWGNQNDNDELDFYNNTFMGFSQAVVSNPDGSNSTHLFLTTQGFGLYDLGQAPPLHCDEPAPCHNDPYWALGNAAHGHEYELDQTDTDGHTLLSEERTQWAAVCPPAGVTGTPASANNYGNWDGDLVTELDHSNPVMVCDIQRQQVDDITFDGVTHGPVPDKMTTYSYDSMGRVTSQKTIDTTPVFDLSGNANHATWSGRVSFGQPGLVSGSSDPAVSLDGNTGEIDTDYVQPPVSAYSVEAWIKTTDGGTRKAIVNDRGSGGGGQSLTLQLSGGKPYFELESNFLEVGVIGPTAINDGQPHHLVGTWSGAAGSAVTPSQFTLYVDGSAVPTTTVVNGSATAPVAGSGGTKIGRHDAWGTNLAGTVDEVAIYQTALTATQVQAHHTAGANYQTTILQDHPSAYYRLDDGTVGTNAGPTAIEHNTAYIQDTSLALTSNSATGHYLVDYPAFNDIEDTGGNRFSCNYTTYDGMTWNSGEQSALTQGQVTTSFGFAGCGTPGNNFSDQTGASSTHHTYDVVGNQLTTTDPDASAGVAGHTGCTVGSTAYTACATFDGTFGTLPTSSANALNQVTTTGYQSPGPPSATIVDSSAHANQAAWNGAVGFGAPGLVAGSADTAMTFDGASGFISGPALTPLQGGSTRSVELWFQTSSTGSQQLLDASSTATAGQAFQIGLTGTGTVGGNPSSNAPGVYLNLVGDDVYIPGLNLGDSKPHHLVVTLSGTTVSIYVDGATPSGLVWNGSAWSSTTAQPFTLPVTPNTTSTPLWIGQARGAIWGNGSAFFTGTLGDVAIYPTALSSARVQAHRSAGSGYAAAVLADSPTAYYRLDDDTGAASPFGGFGLWPLTATDANGQTTRLTYDALGRQTSQTLPGESGSGVPAVLADSSGNAKPAAWSGGVGFGTAGLVSGSSDKAMTFDGVSGHVSGPALPPLQGTGPRSVELWFQTSSTGSQQLLDASNTFTAGQSFQIGLTGNGAVGGSPPSNTPGVYLNLFSDDVYIPGLNLGDGHVHQLVVTLSGSSVSIYVDGATPSGLIWNGSAWSGTTSQPFTLPVAPNTTATPLWIGQARRGVWGAGNQFFTGTIGEVSVYGTALTAARVQAHLTAGSGYGAAVLSDAPTAYYRLGDTAPGQTTQTTSYTVYCSGTGSQTPCVEIDKAQRLNNTTTVTSRSFYDGLGRLVETRSPAPGGQDVVQYATYDAGQRLAFKSVPYFVSAYAGGPGAAAYATPDGTQAGTIYDSTQNNVVLGKYDGLGRLLASTNALSHTSTTTYTVQCAPAGTGDTGCFEQTMSTDANGHQAGTLVDALGRTAYVQRYTGKSTTTYALYATAKYTYDFAGNLVRILEPDGSTAATFGYDMLGRKTSINDPDLGAQTYTYDQNGNQTQSVDARGSAGAIFTGYDGLNRQIWRNTSNSPTGAYDTYSYDSTVGSNVGIGHLTSEAFAVGALSGSESYSYDTRGKQTNTTLTVGGTAYPLGSTYDDAGNVLTQSYPDGETITNGYTAQGWLSQVATSQGGTTLASNLAYTGVGGAFGKLTGASIGNATYTYSATYDLLDRATDLKTTKTSGGAVMFDQSRTFDAAGNVSTASMTMPGGTDNQSFCYDEQDRLTWASGATATPPCGGSNTAGTLSAASYTQTFAYDVMGRLTSGPLGSYTYGDPAHVHAATGIGSAYTATYDAAGNMTCRAPSGSTTCSGTQTGAQLGYNNEGELQAWQNAPSSPTSTSSFLYDGQGQRVEQSVTQSGTTTVTVYVGDVEEVSTTGATTTTTAYYYAGGKRTGLSVNGAISYFASDGLGSSAVTLSSGGSATAAQLFAPYGAVRYSSGTMPTTYGFTGQRSDTASGLDYYGARYYDPVAGQFTSTDSVLPGGGFDPWGLSRYAYVEGNPEISTDPTGHINLSVGDDGSAVPIENAFRGTYSWGASTTPTYHSGFTRVYPTARSRYQRWTPPPRPAPRKAVSHAVTLAKKSNLNPNLAATIYNWADSNVGFFIGHQDYYSIGGGYDTRYFGFGFIFDLTVTPDKIYATQGFGFGSPGASGWVAGGRLLQPNPSTADIDGYVSGPSLVGGGASGVGLNGVWGNEPDLNSNAFGTEIVAGNKQYGVYQTQSLDTSDPLFIHQFFFSVWPTDAPDR